MASTEMICARLCLLTRSKDRKDAPAPLSRTTVRKMLRLGAVEGLALRSVPDIKEEHYERAKALFSHSTEVYARLEQFRAEGWDVLLPEDDDWPVNLSALGTQMPLFLFVRGDCTLFSRRAVSAAGSRRIAEETKDAARQCGKMIAQEGFVLVCGGAEGVDTAVQQGALEQGGSVILVPAVRVEALLYQKYLLDALEAGRLLSYLG